MLTAYGIGAGAGADRPDPPGRIGRGYGHLHEIRDQAGIISRLVDSYARIKAPAEAPALVAEAFRAMASGRPGPAALECAMDMWGKRGKVDAGRADCRRDERRSTRRRSQAAEALGNAERILIVCGGGAQDASRSHRVLARCCRRRCSRSGAAAACSTAASPFSVTLPLGRDLWGEADVCSASARGCSPASAMGHRRRPQDRARRCRSRRAGALSQARRRAGRRRGADPARADRRTAKHNKRASRHDEMEERQASGASAWQKLAPQIGLSRRDPRRIAGGRHLWWRR